MSNIASLVPITKGDPRGGRVPGQVNKITRLIKTALLLAAEESKHSKNRGRSLKGYLTYIADEEPALFCNLLGRVIPIQAKVKTDFVRPQELTSDMPLDVMINEFERKIKDPNYCAPPRLIEHDRDDDDDETEP